MAVANDVEKWQWLIWWYSNGLIVNCLFQTARVPNLGIRICTTCSHLHPPELVVAIDQGKEYNRVVPLVVVEIGATVRGCLDAAVLVI